MSVERKGGAETAASNRKRSLLFGVLAVALLGLATTAVLAVAAERESDAVESFMHLHGLAVPEWAPDEVYVASHQGLAKIDANGKWSYVDGPRHDFMGFQVNHSEKGVLYSSGHPAPGSGLPNPVGFMSSRDAGESWEIISLAGQVDFHVMTVQRTNGSVIYAYSGGLVRSLDEGESWERLETESTRFGNVFALAVHPAESDTILLGSSSGLYRSQDAGRTWRSVIAQDPVTSVTYAGDRLWAYVASPGAGLMNSVDDGQNWESTGFFVEGNDAISFIAPRPGREETLYLGSFSQGIYRTTDGGKSWDQLASGGVPQASGD